MGGYRAQCAAVLEPLGISHVFVPKAVSCGYPISELSNSLRASAGVASLQDKLQGIFGPRDPVNELDESATGGLAPVLGCVCPKEVRGSCTVVLGSMVNDHFFDVCWSG